MRATTSRWLGLVLLCTPLVTPLACSEPSENPDSGSGGTDQTDSGGRAASGGASSGGQASGGKSSGGGTGKPWECWLGDEDERRFCTCWQSDLKPFDGSSAIGNSCAESNGGGFKCCYHTPGGPCECSYATMNECDNVDPEILVESCPPGEPSQIVASGGSSTGGSGGTGGAESVCDPVDRRCEGNTVEACRSDGSGWELSDDCDATQQSCAQGECIDRICTPDELFCKDGNAHKCSADGFSSTLSDSCSQDEYCDEGACVIRACTPLAPTCVLDVVGTCAPDGRSAAIHEESEDCEAGGKVCWDGACEIKACEPNTFFCDGDSVFTCEDNGTRPSHLQDCGNATYCLENGGAASCVPNLCSPTVPTCNGNRPAVCNDDGSGYQSSEAECPEGEHCVLGTCLPIVCEPGDYFCGPDGDVLLCDANGTTASVADDCTLNEYCEEGATTCKQDRCTANQPTCDGNAAATCAPDGSGPLPGATPCEEGYLCVSGTCREVYCAPNQKYCENESLIRLCNSTGTGFSSEAYCTTNTHCGEIAPDRFECFDDICNVNRDSCFGEQLAKCWRGHFYSDLGTDCAALGMVCNGTECVEKLVETVGGTTTSASVSANVVVANVYRFSGPRTITEIEQYLGVAGVDQLTWFIYERPLAGILDGGPFTKVFERLTTSSGTIYHSSGTLSVTVEASKTYLIGVRIASPATTYYGNQNKIMMSGGYVYRRYSTTYANTPLPTSLIIQGYLYPYAQRLTYE